MQFELDQEQHILKESLSAFVRDRYGDNQRSDYRRRIHGYSEENWRSLAELGVLGLPFAGTDGGMAGGPRELVTVMEVLGSGFVVEPFLEEIVVAGGILSRSGSSDQRQAWLQKLIQGKAHLALAHVEHRARYNLAYVELAARARGDAVFLDGAKSLVPLAAAADQWIVSARENGDPPRMAFYLVDPAARGIERRDLRLSDGSIASSIEFREVETNGRLDADLGTLEAVIDDARLAAGAEMVGIMDTLFAATLDYLKNRRQFGMPLSGFQALQHRLADLYVALEQSRSQVYRAAACIGPGAGGRRSVAGMKSYVSRAARSMGEECVHLHGGIGMTDDLMLGHGYKRLVVLAGMYGDADAELVRFNQLSASAGKITEAIAP